MNTIPNGWRPGSAGWPVGEEFYWVNGSIYANIYRLGPSTSHIWRWSIADPYQYGDEETEERAKARCVALLALNGV
jgi:hypothetical protein